MTGAEQAGIDEFFFARKTSSKREEMRQYSNILENPVSGSVFKLRLLGQRQIQKEELEHRAKARDALILWTVLPAIMINRWRGHHVLFCYVAERTVS